MKFEIQRCQQPKDGLNSCCGITVLNQRDGLLPQTRLLAQRLLAPTPLLACAADKIPDLPWFTSQTVHESNYALHPINRQYRK